MNDNEIDNYTLEKGMSYDQYNEGYGCDNGDEVLVLGRLADEFRLTFGTRSKKLYQSWKNYADNNQSLEYADMIFEQGHRMFVYRYLHNFKDPNILGSGLKFSQQMDEEGNWFGSITISVFY